MDRAAQQRHTPVMLPECLDLLAPAVESIAAQGFSPVLIDATLGMGGHTEALLAAHPALTVLGIDRDPQALQLAGDRLANYAGRFQGVHATYDQIEQVTATLPPQQRLSGVLFDLGVSSLQLDEAERGFAYSYDAPLDMRMDASDDSPDETVAELLARIEEDQLRHILRTFGEEKMASRIARRIVAARDTSAITTTSQLAAIIDHAVPAVKKRTGGHPAKRSFQALRIAVNRELEVLENAIVAACEAVALGGRVVAMSYHSLEDRIVKQAFAARAQSSAPVGLPVELEEHKPTFALVTRGAQRPTEQEISDNPRAASAKLRGAEKIKTMVRSST